MSDLLQGWEEEPIPPSIEIAVRDGTSAGELNRAIAAWHKDPAVSMIDDDREWLRQLQTVVTVVRAVGFLLGGILLGAAGFTIASIIRLTAYLHREEIAVMRLVGATEFFIRGPFYVEGLIQGLVGGLLASGGLFLGFRLLQERAGSSLIPSLLASEFLEARQIALLVAVGAFAGLFGAVVSLRREAL
jgi:cell division transport system permease protein